jgi:3-phosphoinositide dependent protein kinase-1
MLTGTTPFKAASEYLIFEKIREGNVDYPTDMAADAKDFVQKLLVTNPQERLGYDCDFASIKRHPFLDCIPVDDIYNVPAPMAEETKINVLNTGEPVIIVTGLV